MFGSVTTRLFALIFVLFSTFAYAQEAKWYRGNTHAHSLWSDGNDFAEMIIGWYYDNGYDFAMLSDHDILSVSEKWLTVEKIEARQRTLGRRAIEKCQRRFGDDWLEFREKDGKKEVRLRRLAEFRGRFEEPGKFLIMQAEEISNTSIDGKPVHINAINLPGKNTIPSSKKKKSVREIIRDTMRAVAQREEETGVPILTHLNHPNFQWGVSVDDLANVVEEQFFEVYNGHPGIRHLGDAEHPSDEQIWDLVNTIRLRELNAPPLYGLATDDSHTYHGGGVSPGRGWVMVRSKKLHGDDLVRAMRAGDFYSSSGVFLDAIDYADGVLEIKIRPNKDATFTSQLIGTIGDEIGKVFAVETGNTVRFEIPPDALYARVTITSSRAHPNPSFEAQMEQAWTQPVAWSRTEP